MTKTTKTQEELEATAADLGFTVQDVIDLDAITPRKERADKMLQDAMKTLYRAFAERDDEWPITAALTMLEAIEQLKDVIAIDVYNEKVASDLSWKNIGDSFGITRQAAQQRFGVRADMLDDEAEWAEEDNED